LMMMNTVSSFNTKSLIRSFNSVNKNSYRSRSLTSFAAKGPRPIHKEFTVEKATPEQKELLDIVSWPTWSTAGNIIRF